MAVEGLHLCLLAVGRAIGTQFEIWDWGIKCNGGLEK